MPATLFDVSPRGSSAYTPPTFSAIGQGLSQLGAGLGAGIQDRRKRKKEEEAKAALQAAFDMYKKGGRDAINDPAMLKALWPFVQADQAQKNADRTFGLQERQFAAAEAARAAAAAAKGRPKTKAADGHWYYDDGEKERVFPGVAGDEGEPDIDAEAAFRKEFAGLSKDFKKTQDAYRKITNTSDTAAGDVSLVFGYMKMLDPLSVVREGEFATAENTAGIPGRISNLYNKALAGHRLTPQQRSAFKNEARTIYDGQLEQQEALFADYEEKAGMYGWPADRVLTRVVDAALKGLPPIEDFDPNAGALESALNQVGENVVGAFSDVSGALGVGDANAAPALPSMNVGDMIDTGYVGSDGSAITIRKIR